MRATAVLEQNVVHMRSTPRDGQQSLLDDDKGAEVLCKLLENQETVILIRHRENQRDEGESESETQGQVNEFLNHL